MTPGALRTWLMRQPRPAYVVADEKRIDVAKTPRPWPELLDTLLALKPASVTLHAEGGVLLRARELSWGEDGEESTASASEPKGKTDLQVFAALLADAYDKGSKSYSPLLDSAMSFIERQGQHLLQKDKEIASLRAHNTKLQAELLAYSAIPEQQENEQGILGMLATGIAQAHANATATPPEVPAANGKKVRA